MMAMGVSAVHCSLLFSTDDLAGHADVDGGPPASKTGTTPTDATVEASDAPPSNDAATDSAGGDPEHVLQIETIAAAPSTGVAVTFLSPVAAGDTVICYVFSEANNVNVTSFTDSVGDTFSFVDKVTSGGFSEEIWYVSSAKGGNAVAVTAVTDTYTGRRGISCHEYRGALTLFTSRSQTFSAGQHVAAPITLPAPSSVGLLFQWWGASSGLGVATAGWTKRSQLDGDYIGDRVIRAGESISMEATCQSSCVLLGGAFMR